MKLFKFMFNLFVLLLAIPAFTADFQDQPSINSLKTGQYEILVIPDIEGTMDKSLIPDINKYPELESLFANAPLPAVDRVFFLKNGSQNILVDTGWGTELQNKGNALMNLKRVGINPEDITDILLTHMDFDHIGGLIRDDKPVFPNATLWISQPEYTAWSKGDIKARGKFALDLAKKVIEIYNGKIKTFNFGDEIFPTIIAVDASGHTPGHTAYDFNGGQFVIVGDLLHVAPVQLLQPSLSSIYDMDPEKAAQSRENLLKKIVKDKSIMAGMHVPMISQVKENDNGGFLMRQPR